MKTSKLFTIDWRDFLHGLIAAAAASVLPVIDKAITDGSFVFNFTDIWHAAAAGAWSYILIRFFTKSKEVHKAE